MNEIKFKIPDRCTPNLKQLIKFIKTEHTLLRSFFAVKSIESIKFNLN